MILCKCPQHFLGRGATRIRNAVFAKAYGSSDALEKLAESMDNNVKNITNAMLIVAPRMAAMQDAVKAGKLYPLDITEEIVAAITKLSQLREQGISVANYLSVENRDNLFGAKELEPLAKDVLSLFDRYKKSSKKIAQLLNYYVDGVIAVGDPDQGALWGDAPPPTKAEVLQDSLERTEGEDEQNQAALFGNQTVGGQEDRKVKKGDGRRDRAKSQETEREGPNRRLKREAPGAVAPIFYSQLQRVIEQKMPNRAVPNQILAIIKGGQVKAEEIKWSDIEDWLKEQNGRVTKHEVLDFLRANDEKVLHAEEIQSDCHQEGRKKGYTDSKLTKAANDARQEYEDYTRELF